MNWRMAGSLNGLRNEVNSRAPERSVASDGGIGDTRHASRKSDHNPCDCCGVVCAFDFTHDPAAGFDADAFAEWLRERVTSGMETRVKYVIWNRQIFSGPAQGKLIGEWRPYKGSNPHTKHVHVSVRHGGGHDDDAPWGWASLLFPAPGK